MSSYLSEEKDDFVIINSLKFNHNDLDLIQIENNDDILITFDVFELINSIIYSYKSKKQIYNQYIVDAKRTTIFKNNTNQKINYLQLIKLIMGDKNTSKKLICFTQSVFYWPYQLIKNKYKNLDLHLGEPNKNKKSYIKYIDKNNFIIYKELRLFEVNGKGDDKTHKIVKIEIHISFDKSSVLIIS